MTGISGAELVGTWIAAILTIAILSFLYKDNPVYKVAEHIFVGVSAGYQLIRETFDVIWPNLLQPLVDGARRDPDTLKAHPYWYIYAVPLLFALLMFARLNKRVSYLGRWPVSYVVGAFAGTSIIAAASADLVIQVQSSMVSLRGGTAWTLIDNPVSAALSTTGLICALIYFFFSKEHKGWLGVVARLGIYFMMISFGGSFGFTVMGRLSLAVGRTQSLVVRGPLNPMAPWPAVIGVLLVAAGIVIWELRVRRRGAPPA